ncbi:J domain-containing protein [Desulfonatronovibrio magnus]|uniref:J domain-containing protein n=1 Tax=Desulfonatronovibrio magnus TaxID=698827 RepID=UPI0005EBCA13|nr:J domain-containing protein [Desulfonatronovibrio magnus]
MMKKYCIDCGRGFWAERGETWKVRCISCWKQQKEQKQHANSSDHESMLRALIAKVRDLQIENNNLRTEIGFMTANGTRQSDIPSKLKAKYRDLIFLCHPDKHDGHPKAVEVASWLNSEVRNA